MTYRMKLTVFALAACAATILAAQGSSYAGKISDYDYIMKTEYAQHQGVITSISPAGDFLVVSGRKVWLVAVDARGATLETMIHTEGDNLISLGKLHVGDWVYVFGGGRRDNEIAAKDIYLLPTKLSDSQFKLFIRDKGLRTWKSEIFPVPGRS